MRILIVDDDARFAGVLSAGLERLGHKCFWVEPPAATAAVAERPYDLAVVDVDGEDGRAFVGGYRRVAPGLGVIALSAALSTGTAVEVLRGGDGAAALDYIEKPEPDLLRRIDEIGRTRFARIERGLWSVDLEARRGYYDGAPLDLTEREYDLFRAFMESPYRELSYSDLAAAVYGRQMSYEEAYTSLRSLVSRLRTKTRRPAGRNVLSRHADGAGIRFVPEGVGPRRRDISKS